MRCKWVGTGWSWGRYCVKTGMQFRSRGIHSLSHYKLLKDSVLLYEGVWRPETYTLTLYNAVRCRVNCTCSHSFCENTKCSLGGLIYTHTCRWVPTFRRSILIPSSELEHRRCSSETSAPTYKSVRRHNPETNTNSLSFGVYSSLYRFTVQYLRCMHVAWHVTVRERKATCSPSQQRWSVTMGCLQFLENDTVSLM